MSSVLITVTGPDQPGVTGVLFTALATHRVEVLDIDQAVIRGQLTLGVLVGTAEDPEGLKRDVQQAMAELAMTVRVAIDQPGDDQRRLPDARRGRARPAAAGRRDRRTGPALRPARGQHRGDQTDRGLPGDRSGAVRPGAGRRCAAGRGRAGRRRGRGGHRGRTGRDFPAGEAADRLRRRFHPDHRRGDRDARRTHRHPRPGRAHHRRRNARRAGFRRLAAGPGGDAGGSGRRHPRRGRRCAGADPWRRAPRSAP